MKNITMLTGANLRKNKGQTVSLLLFVLIAAMLMNIGLTVLLGIGSFFDERAQRVHMAHFTAIYYAGTEPIDEGARFIETYPGVTETETLNTIGGRGHYYVNDQKSTCLIILSPAGTTQKMDAPSLIGRSLPLTGDAIYIPYFMMHSSGYEIGDEFRLNLLGTDMRFTIAGATEEIMFGSSMTADIHRFYVSDEKYSDIQKQFPDSGITLLSARLENNDETAFFQADYNREVSKDGLYADLIYDNAKQGRTMIPQIAAIIMTVFAIILLAVSMIVIRFRITNSIEESMVNIGAQKAIGYRSAQIVTSIVMQFGIVAIAGSIIGVGLSQLAIPIIMNIFKPMIAMVWNPGFDASAAIISIALNLLTVALISYITSLRINKLHPLIALRGGITTHSFRKNPLPLDKTRGGLNLLLAMKQLLRNKRQTITITIIVAAVTMASVSGIAMHDNMSGEENNFARTMFGEMPDVNFYLSEGTDGDAFKERLLKRPEVRKAIGYDTSVSLLADEINISTTVVEDCSQLESAMMIDGRYPRHSNEIALGTTVSRVSGKKTGDTVSMRSGDNEKEYIVTGIAQFMNSNGFNGIITGDGIREIQPDYKYAGYNAYLNVDADVKEFIESVEADERALNPDGSVFDSVMDVQDQLSVLMDMMNGIFTAVAVGISTVTLFVVVLVLYMVIKTMILHRRRELGIQKAVGFTTFQLMNQIALNMTPIILFGAVLGAIAGYFGLNSMVAAVTSGMGIVKVSLPVPIDLAVMVCAALVIVAYTVSMLIAWRIRKISAYTMVTE